MKVLNTTAALAILSAASFAAAHMEMKNPPPLRSKFNKFSTNIDYDMVSPMAANGANFPCKGHLSVLGTLQARPVADWIPGQPQSMTITGGANHNGGSCQASLSFDSGKTWKVIHSWIGNCPLHGDSTLKFTVPSDTPSGPALFAWSWFNQIGNREMYMNCASITIAGSGKKLRGSTQSLRRRPDMFVANVGNGCGTIEGRDLLFPNPGPDVDMNSENTAPATGRCPGYSPVGGSSPAPTPKLPGGKKHIPTHSRPSMSHSKPTFHPKPPYAHNGKINPSAPKAVHKTPIAKPVPSKASVPVSGKGACAPGTYSCSSDSRALQVCGANKVWIRMPDCGPGQICHISKSNNTPYCFAE
ncbi:hypothetical protein E4U17_002439 [Claviceps sp. LM77 group G4]|nr:hypothetical protein E4U17_002439 [Claviceps sp. LM77 group G4]KAG6074621.1 hypothetical protein E4U33_002425 [Claviceps sp. LM78 group G4]KAG6076535.1 hypothetical protein E4U16_002732 [Claviceps sp. LM84 group G4]